MKFRVQGFENSLEQNVVIEGLIQELDRTRTHGLRSHPLFSICGNKDDRDAVTIVC